MIRAAALAILLVLGHMGGPCWGQASTGAPPPPIEAPEVLQAPDGTYLGWNALRGKVVIVDFWATWCGPCVASLPHINKLVEEFAGKSVVFISVTDDDRETLDRFLKSRPLKTWIVRDPHRENWKRFGVASIPRLFVVDSRGILVGETTPENVTSEVLNKLIRNQSVNLPPGEKTGDNLNWDEELINWQDGVRPEMYAIVKPIKIATGGVWPRPEGNRLTADGVPLAVLLQLAFSVDPHHFDNRLPKEARTYRAAFRVPMDRSNELRPLMRDTLARMFPIKTRWAEQERPVKILTRLPGAGAPPESRALALARMMRGKITLRRQSVGRLCEFLSSSYGRAVIDETSLAGEFDFDLPYQPGEPAITEQALRTAGFNIVDGVRSLRILIVESEERKQPSQK
jgi:uncharacterized protein (TIGR03435 family)